MKTIHLLNTTIYIPCILMWLISLRVSQYSEFRVLSIYAYIILGISQPLMALIAIGILNLRGNRNINYLGKYLVLIVIFFLVFFISAEYNLKILLDILKIVPMVLATYFVYATYKTQQKTT